MSYDDPTQAESADETAIAVVGMAGRFPGARDVREFWQNLRDGVESISRFTDEELKASGVDEAALGDPNYVKAGAVLDGVELFDAQFFGFNPREAEIMDPQQRAFLECSWEALESAGYDAETYKGAIGVYAGVSQSTYLINIYLNPDLMRLVDGMQIGIGNDKDYLSTRVSYKLNLKGPSVNVQSACSTSLVAVHQACQSLLNGECDMALAGGVSITLPQKRGYVYREGGIVSPDGHCRAFDARAEGTIGGSGVGVVVLKLLTAALADGDQIHAVIKGSAVNNDGALKIGYTAPGVEGQSKVIAEALAVAGVDADTVSYVEAHGTGTALGDPIEVAALTQAFRAATERKNFCAIGSVKTNVGHLDAAAGVTGLIKTVLSLKHREIPATLHFQQPNPKIDFAESPFYVNSRLSEWGAGETPRRAGVSSFGIGGTNAHVIVEEAPEAEASGPSRPAQLLVLSAKTPTALEAATANLARHLREHPGVSLADVAFTQHCGRREFNHRRMVVCRDTADAARALEAPDAARVFTEEQAHRDRPVVFMFPGQGAQYVGMTAGLYQTERVFREELDRCSEALAPLLNFDLRDVLYASEGRAEYARQRLTQTSVTQPALFAVEYALARLLMSWGVQPKAFIGHSIGEYVAACLAGVFTAEEALALVAARGRLMQSAAEGSMLAVPLPEQEVRPLLGEHLSLAAVNGPARCVVAGPVEAVERFERELAARGVGGSRLQTSHAFHSAMMDPILGEFVAQFARVKPQAPRIPFVSNLTGEWVTAEQATDPHYWAAHLRQTVLFEKGFGELAKEPDWMLLEVGPGRTLTTLVNSHPAKAAGQRAIPTVRHAQDATPDTEYLLGALGRLWLSGVHVAWQGFYADESRRRMSLPTYPFERQRYWVERRPLEPEAGHKAPPVKQGIEDWFYSPSWKRSASPRGAAREEAANAKHCWLVFTDECGVGAGLVERLRQTGQDVVAVAAGAQFARLGESLYAVEPRGRAGYDALFRELRAAGRVPRRIVHLWSVTPGGQDIAGMETADRHQALGFDSLVCMAQSLGEQVLAVALSERGAADAIRIAVVSNNMQAVTGEEDLCPAKSLLLGPCKVIPMEYPNVECRSIDIALTGGAGPEGARVVERLLGELSGDNSDRVIAYRGSHRWVQTFEQVRLKGRAFDEAGPREGGAYLITGGLGGVGLELAAHLGKTARARLVLVGRSSFPARGEWAGWLATHDADEETSVKIRRLMEVEAAGAQVLTFSADVADLEQMRAVAARAAERFGPIRGVIHAAGVAGGGMIQLMTPEMAASVLAPKVAGTYVLEALFGDAPLDFFVLCSSQRSILGGVGRAEYCAANAFLDAFAHRGELDGRPFRLSVNWDTWREVGMAVNAARHYNLDAEETIREGLSSKEGVQVFERVLRGGLPQVVVSTQDLQGSIEQAEAFSPSDSFAELEKPTHAKALYPRPQLSTPYVAPTGEAESVIAEVWQQVLGVETVGINDNFFDLGGDSILSIQIIARANQSGLRLTPKQIFQHPTVAQLAQAAAASPATTAEQGAVTGEVPLTPIQRWYFEQEPEDISHFNQSVMLRPHAPVDIEALRRVVARLLEHHDALRLRFTRTAEGWRQHIPAPGGEDVTEVIDLRSADPGERGRAVTEAAEGVQRSLDIERGPLMRVALIRLRGEGGAEEQRVLLAVHHLAVDGVSWRVLLEDLQRGYEQARRGMPVEFGEKTTSFKAWAEGLTEYASSQAIEGQRSYWQRKLEAAADPMPVDFEGGENVAGDVETVGLSLDEGLTRRLLLDAGRAYNTRITELLLAALAGAWRRWSSQGSLRVDLEGHGREQEEVGGSDVTRTVGWFTTIYPVVVSGRGGVGECVKAAKEELRGVPGGGIGYGLLKYMDGGAQWADEAEAEVSFLYLGQLDQVFAEGGDFSPAAESAGETRSPGMKRKHLLEVNGIVVDGRLQMGWSYSRGVHRRESIEALVGEYEKALIEVIEHCTDEGAGGYTPSDFPDAELSQDDLDELIAELSASE